MVKDKLRYFVLKTGRYHPFRAVYKLMYLLILKLFVFYMRTMPEVKAVYLRGSLSSQEWVPGDSDIDLTIIIKDLVIDDEIKFLPKFWSKLFFGANLALIINENEIGLLTESEFKSENFRRGHALYLFDTPIKEWRLLLGKELRSLPDEITENHNTPISFFISWLYNNLLSGFFGEIGRNKDFLRFYHKMSLKLLKAVSAYQTKAEKKSLLDENGFLKKGYWSDNPPEDIITCLYFLTKKIDSFYHNLLANNNFEGERKLDIKILPQEKNPDPRVADEISAFIGKLPQINKMLKWVISVYSAMIGETALYLVAKQDCQFAEFRAMLMLLKQELPKLKALKIAPFVTSENIFAGELTFLGSDSAVDYFYIKSQGEIIFGNDAKNIFKRPPDELLSKKFAELAFRIKYTSAKCLLREPVFDLDWKIFYELLGHRLRTERGIIIYTVPQTLQEYLKEYGHEEQTEWLKNFSNKNLYLFTKYILNKFGY